MYSKNKRLLRDKTHYPSVSPHRFFQTYWDKSKVPREVYENIARFAPTYSHEILDDDDCETFLSTYFTANVLHAFRSFKQGAHKADLVRYALLYIHGGVYMDIHKELLIPLDDMIRDKHVIHSIFSTDHISQGFISAPSRHPLFLSLIDYVIQGEPLFYHDFCKDFLYQIQKDTNAYMTSGLYQGRNTQYYLFTESCSSTDCSLCGKFDRYGLCCMIYDKKKPVIYARRHSYPW